MYGVNIGSLNIYVSEAVPVEGSTQAIRTVAPSGGRHLRLRWRGGRGGLVVVIFGL